MEEICKNICMLSIPISATFSRNASEALIKRSKESMERKKNLREFFRVVKLCHMIL